MKLCFSGIALKSKALNFSVGLAISSYVKWVRDAFNCKMGILIRFLVNLDDKLWKHFENQRSKSAVAHLCQTLCHSVGCGLPGSSVHGIFQARVLEWVAISFSRVFLLTQGSNPGLPHCRQTLYHLSHQGSPKLLNKSKSLSLFLGIVVSHYTFVH